jgi:integrase/recombinase XerD
LHRIPRGHARVSLRRRTSRLAPSRVDIGGQTIIFESLKKRRRGIYRAVPVPETLIDQLDMVHGIREAHRRRKKDILDAPLWPIARNTAWRRACTPVS